MKSTCLFLFPQPAKKVIHFISNLRAIYILDKEKKLGCGSAWLGIKMMKNNQISGNK